MSQPVSSPASAPGLNLSRDDLDLAVSQTHSFSPHTYFIHVFLTPLSLSTPYRYLMIYLKRGDVTLEKLSLSYLLDVIHGSFRFDS